MKTRFTFKNKLVADGSIEKYKSRLVVRDYTQRSGVDFFETFCPVFDLDSTGTALAVSASQG